jgi:hypothetical protein
MMLKPTQIEFQKPVGEGKPCHLYAIYIVKHAKSCVIIIVVPIVIVFNENVTHSKTRFIIDLVLPVFHLKCQYETIPDISTLSIR